MKQVKTKPTTSAASLVHPIATRAWVRLDSSDKPRARRRRAARRKPWQRAWPHDTLVFDTETRTDASQRLMVGFYRVLHDDTVTQEGIFTHEDEAYSSDELRALDAYCAAHPELMRHTRESFVRDVFYPMAYKGQCAVVGFNLPFDLSRLAGHVTATKRGTAKTTKSRFTFTLVQKRDTRGRKATYRKTPRLRIDPHIGQGASIAFVSRKHGRFLDLQTLTTSLTGTSQSLASACTAFHTYYQKAEHPAFGTLTTELLDYARQDVAATASLYHNVLDAYARHPIAIAPDRVYSPASIGKGYLAALGLSLPALTIDPNLYLSPDDVFGFAMASYYGARAECRIRRTAVPVVYADFRSMYPTVNALMHLWPYVIASEMQVCDATRETQAFLERVTANDLFNPDLWPQLTTLCQVQPDGEPLIHRVKLHDNAYSAYTLSVGPLRTYTPSRWTLADCIVAKLRSGTAPRIIRALHFTAGTPQAGLSPVTPPNMPSIDPSSDDFFVYWIRERGKVKRSEPPYDRLSDAERDGVQRFMKIMANATSYGIYVEMNRQEGAAQPVHGYDVRPFVGKVGSFEAPGRYCFPPIAAFITGAARLMLGLAEHEVTRRGGRYATMDTDALTIVATPEGDLVPCPGGPERLTDESAAIRAVSWAEVDAIRARFRALNPYGDGHDILELESENVEPVSGEQQQLWCFAIASKRYCLYTIDGDGAPNLRKVSEHGLGAFTGPDGVDHWQEAFWQAILRREVDPNCALPEWFDQNVIAQQTIASPAWHAWFERWNTDKPTYHEQVKPFNFLSHPLIRHDMHARVRYQADPSLAQPATVSLVAPFGERTTFFDRHQPDAIYVAGQSALVESYADLLETYRLHPERKFLGPDGKPCFTGTHGLLSDRLTIASCFVQVGKEAHDLEARLAHLESEEENVTTYDDPQDELFRVVLADMSSQVLSRACGVAPRTVRDWKEGHYLPRHRETVVLLAAEHAREHLLQRAYDPSTEDREAIALYASILQAQAAHDETSRETAREERQCKHDFLALVRQITNGKLTRPLPDTLTEWRSHVPRALRNQRRGVPVDDVAASLAEIAPWLGITSEDDFYHYCTRLWRTT